MNIPNMRDTYGVYYDWAAYFKFENVDWYYTYFESDTVKEPYNRFIDDVDIQKILKRIENKEFFGYSGIVHPDELEKSNEVRLSSIPKGEMPICFMTYNKDAYTCHCRDYKEYKEWEEKRNPVRYESNLGHNYDAKNVMHCMRLIRMAKELAQGKGFNVARNEDREYLLDIRNHKFEYEDVMAQLEQEKAEMEAAITETTLRDVVDYDWANEVLKRARNIAYNQGIPCVS